MSSRKFLLLTEKNLLKNPLRQFSLWFEAAQKCKKIGLPSAMCVSTVDARGHPSSRMILLKGFGPDGFVFYTNLNSPKARDFFKNPFASLTFYWAVLGYQVRIDGRVRLVGKREADTYFETRPRESQIGAWASLQSEVLESRALLEKRFSDFEKKFRGKKVPRPSHWSGFRVIPQKIEFWQERPNRLHDRFLYTYKKGKWQMCRLYP